MTEEVRIVTPTNPTEGIVKCVAEIRSMVEDKSRTQGELQTKIDKMEKDLSSYEQKNQELSGKLAQQVKEAEEQKKIVDALERNASKGNTAIQTKDGVEIYNPEMVDAYDRYFCARDGRSLLANDPIAMKYYHGHDCKIQAPIVRTFDKKDASLFHSTKNVRELEHKYLRTDVNDFGGFLVPPEFMPTLIRRLTEVSPVRQYASSRTTYSNELDVPVRNVLVTGQWGYEGATSIANGSSQYTRPSIHMKRLQVTVPLTIEELMDSPFDMQAEVSNDVNEEFARLEGQGFVTGDDTLQVEGLMTNSQIGYTPTGKAAELTADSLLTMYGAIKYQSYGNQMYDRTYMFNRRTWIKILQLKDGIGQYIWAQGNIEKGIPNTILGASYIIAPDMPDVGAGNYPVLMGDFKKGYMIVDRMLMYMVRDEMTVPGFIKYTFIRRLGAKVILPEAFNKLKVSVS
jgi:HK97 family phage major capsid protein